MSRLERCLLLAAVALLAACPGKKDKERAPIRKTALPPAEVRADDPDLIQYTLGFDQRRNHYVEVEAVFPAAGDTLDVVMAVWTPGSYLVREYSRHIEGMSAATVDGEPLRLVKEAKNRWRVHLPRPADRVVIRYRLYARELSVRTNYVTDQVAILNGAPTFLRIADDQERPFDVALELPESWPDSVTALAAHPAGAPHRYVAPDYDTLVDSPIVAGDLALYDFDIEGIPHVLANFGEGGIWDGARSAEDVETLARAHIDFWGEIPYRRYVFQNMLLESGGGLEHKSSTLMLGSRWAMRKREDYTKWLGLVSHEFFHTWNIKRLRPAALGPFDYHNENYTRSLWVAEGVTSYYDDLLMRRAGLLSDDEYLEKLSKQIETLQTTPGRQVQSLSASSFDAWIKFYRRDENSTNTQVSYYTKGAVVSFLLDAEIRRVTQNRRSLDDVMRLAYQRFSGDRGYTPEELRAVVAEVAEEPLDDFFARAVDGTDELDYGPALEYFGLRFAEEGEGEEDGDGSGDEAATASEPAGYLGVEVGEDGVVTKVLRDTPAYAAGINVGDELLALGDYRVRGDKLAERLERYRPGEQVSALVARRGRLRRLDVQLGDKPPATWKLAVDSEAGSMAASRRQRWLAGEPK